MDKNAELGVGMMIVFISLILVSAMAASVVIQVSNQARERASETGVSSIKSVSSGLMVKDVSGHVAYDRYEASLNINSGVDIDGHLSFNIGIESFIIEVATSYSSGDIADKIRSQTLTGGVLDGSDSVVNITSDMNSESSMNWELGLSRNYSIYPHGNFIDENAIHGDFSTPEMRCLEIIEPGYHYEGQIVITLNEMIYNLPVTASVVTSSQLAQEIADYDFGPDWTVAVWGSVVNFTATTNGSRIGTFDMTSEYPEISYSYTQQFQNEIEIDYIDILISLAEGSEAILMEHVAIFSIQADDHFAMKFGESTQPSKSQYSAQVVRKVSNVQWLDGNSHVIGQGDLVKIRIGNIADANLHLHPGKSIEITILPAFGQPCVISATAGECLLPGTFTSLQ